MPTQVFHAVVVGDKSRAVIAEDVAEYSPDTVRVYTLDHAEPTIEDEIAASREVARQGLIAPSGVADAGSVELVKGLCLAQLTMTEWAIFDGAGTLLDKGTRENVKARLPKPVLRAFGSRLLYGNILTNDELAAAKNS